MPLSIAVNADSLATWFPPLLRELFARRAVALEVVTDDQDHTSARLLRGDPEAVGSIPGSFALVAREGERVLLARSLARKPKPDWKRFFARRAERLVENRAIHFAVQDLFAVALDASSSTRSR